MGEDFSQLVPVATLNARNLGRLKKEVIQDVYTYWKKKRLAAGKPLIGRLQIEEDEIRHSASYVRYIPHLVFQSICLCKLTLFFRNKNANIPRCAR